MAHVIDFKEAGFDSVLDELEWRGLISQSTDRDRLAEALNGEPITYYCGFDPTRRLPAHRQPRSAHQHAPPAGRRTPSDRVGRRRHRPDRRSAPVGRTHAQPEGRLAGWADRLKKQIGGILETEGSNPVRFVSNYDWTASMNVIDFLRDVGKNFRMGTMLAKDTVAPSPQLRGRHLLH